MANVNIAPASSALLRTPKAAAIAGIVFAVLLIAIFALFRSAVPASPGEPGEWLVQDWRTAAFGLNLIPFAGIAFLWFIGVLRDRLGAKEDRFFATVFLGSALIFLAMLFVAGALVGGIILTASLPGSDGLAGSQTFHVARATAYVLINVYAAKIAIVFMVSTSTVLIYTKIAPRWIAILGFILAVVLLTSSYFTTWAIMVLPVWVFLISCLILIDNLKAGSQP